VGHWQPRPVNTALDDYGAMMVAAEKRRVIEILIGPPGSPGKLITDGDIAFRTKHYKGSKPNEGTAVIANLSDATVAAIEAPGNVMQIRAGVGSPGKLFYGDILKGSGVTTKESTPERVTTVKAKDGHRAFRDLTASLAYPPNTPVAQVVKDLVALAQASDRLVLGLGSVYPTDSFPAGWACSGKWRRALTEILAPRGYYWTIQGRVIYIMQQSAQPPGNVPLVSPQTDMVGSPTRTKKGVNFVSRLNPAVVAGFGVMIKSRSINGLYRAAVVEHAGGKRGLEWKTQAQCEAIR